VGFASQIPTFLLAPLAALVDDDKRGRVMSFYAMAFFGTAPLGSLFAGFLASHVGAPLTILIGGASCVVGGLIFARVLPELREIARPIYQRLGILPTDGESATHVDG
jgi:MFS family permease